MPTIPESPIKHVVVLMLENQSFDHIYGYTPGVGSLTEQPQSLPDPRNPYQRLTTYPWSSLSINPCPRHSHADVMHQLYGWQGIEADSTGWPTPPMSGFLANYCWPDSQQGGGDPNGLMGCFQPGQLPALTMLARTYTVCANWFSSVPGPTGPNRLFANCASSGGYAGAAYQYNSNQPSTNMPAVLADLPNIFDSLNGASPKLTWALYHETKSFYPEGVLRTVQNSTECNNIVDPNFTKFCEAAQAGTLANYSFLTPALDKSQHDPWDARCGDNRVAAVYNAIRTSPLWDQTLLLITYDEHGGHFDHVPPPTQYLNVQTGQPTQVTNPSSTSWSADQWPSDCYEPPAFDFALLGVRVPALIISAYTPAGVDYTVYEHSSVPATLNALWGLASLNSRDEGANSVLSNVTTRRPDAELGLAPFSNIAHCLEPPQVGA